MDISKLIKQLGKIPVDDYLKTMQLVEDYELDLVEDANDPAATFQAAIIQLNEERLLPSWLSQYCIMYDVDHNEMEIEPPDWEINI